MLQKINIFWFRRDLRLEDNAGLFHALTSTRPVMPLFIFDTEIVEKLEKDDARITFIFEHLQKIQQGLKKRGSSLLFTFGKPEEVWRRLTKDFSIEAVYCNHDYEPYSISRDESIAKFLKLSGITFKTYKDHVVFEKDEVVKSDASPYTIYTPYSRKWIERFEMEKIKSFDSEKYADNFIKNTSYPFPEFSETGFIKSKIAVPPLRIEAERIINYKETRDFPSADGTSLAGPHLRFGTISVRQLAMLSNVQQNTYLKELIWREFFQQILYFFPHVVNRSFKPKYDNIYWENDERLFERWCQGKTGYPMVDAGMRELKETGFMHNRVRMITAGFLCKHLLIDWRWGEAWFAKHLLDFELASNNGNWQWAAGTGCDAAPYFRVFNPLEQQKKFDPAWKYIKKWVPEINTPEYPQPIVDHKFARARAIERYKQALSGT